jgi:uncharacterized protein
MPRPKKPRTIGYIPDNRCFYPKCSNMDEVVITMVELEAIRLSDLMKLDQDTASERMNISRGTFQRIINTARYKMSDALVNGKGIRIEGGEYDFVAPMECGHRHCAGGNGKGNGGSGRGRQHRGGR